MNLKTRTRFEDMRFAYLIEPDAVVHNNEELYAAVHKHGRAVIREFKAGSLELQPATVLTPINFENNWQGD